MRQVFVMNSGTITGHSFADPSLVTDGVVSVFAEGGTALNVTSAVYSAQRFYIVRGNPDIPQISYVIDPEDVVSINKVDYQASLPQITTITNIPAGSAQSGEAFIKIVDLSVGREQFPRVSVSVDVLATDAVSAIINKIVAAINNNPRAAGVVTASGTATDLVLTGNMGLSFTTALDGTIAEATVTATQSPRIGSGSGQQVLDLERSVIHQEWGDYYVNDGILGRPEGLPTFANTASNYDLYNIRVKNDAVHKGLNSAFAYTDFVIALATSGVTGDLDDFFELD